MDIMKKIELEHLRMDLPKFRSGDTVKVHLRIVEGEKERIQMFQGNVIRIHRGTTGGTFTVRKSSVSSPCTRPSSTASNSSPKAACAAAASTTCATCAVRLPASSRRTVSNTVVLFAKKGGLAPLFCCGLTTLRRGWMTAVQCAAPCCPVACACLLTSAGCFCRVARTVPPPTAVRPCGPCHSHRPRRAQRLADVAAPYAH